MISMVNFKESLNNLPLIFTVIPLRDSKTGDPEHDNRIVKNIEARIMDIAKTLSDFPGLTAINVPELVEENHEGKPRYNSIFTRKLARGIADELGKEAIINKVVAHMESYDEFANWIVETESQGIRNIVLVGGNTRHHRYTGPNVSEANLITKHLMKTKNLNDITIGNICLPERGGEARRMLYKTISGADFFTTQMLFEGDHITHLLKEYGELCSKAQVNPATVILSFAPLKSVADLNLLDFLGVDLPDETKDYILENEQVSKAYKRSIKNALDVLKAIMNDKIDNYPEINIGINVEQLTKSNMPYSIEMLKEFHIMTKKK